MKSPRTNVDFGRIWSTGTRFYDSDRSGRIWMFFSNFPRTGVKSFHKFDETLHFRAIPQFNEKTCSRSRHVQWQLILKRQQTILDNDNQKHWNLTKNWRLPWVHIQRVWWDEDDPTEQGLKPLGRCHSWRDPPPVRLHPDSFWWVGLPVWSGKCPFGAGRLPQGYRQILVGLRQQLDLFYQSSS